MTASPATQPSLLLRVRDPRDAAAWSRFVDVYTPLVFHFCQKRGLQAADAADVAQEVMKAVARAMPHFEYDPSRGPFRAWMYRVTRSKLADFQARRRDHAAGTGRTSIQEVLDAQPADDDADQWERHWRVHFFHVAAETVKAEFEAATWKAFWSTAVEGKPAQAVAAELNLSPGAVYIAKSRVLARLRRAVEDIDDRALD